MKIKLKDGSVKEYEEPKKVIELAGEISAGLERTVCAGRVNKAVVDLRYEIVEDSEVTFLTFEDEEGKAAFRHTAAHILAQAVKRLYPEAKLAIGPAIRDGFYYDIDFLRPFTTQELGAVEIEMKKIVKEELPITRVVLPRQEALSLMGSMGESYKVALIEEIPEDAEISFYEQGGYIDLCAGPHLLNTKPVKAVKLLSIAGAYWKGNEKNRMLTRIYGTAFPKASELEAHLSMVEEAAKRDHRKLGRELGLFTLMEEGPGFPFFLPKGLILKNLLIDYWRKIHEREGYLEIATPILLNRKLWEISGHWDHYRENMYATRIDEEDYIIKPMNCPGGMLVYQSEPHSYRELPLRIGELGLVHRHEKSGALHGLMRVRSFTQDDAHIFMMKNQVTEEIKAVVRLIDEVYGKFGFRYHVELSTRPEDSIGCDEDWELATRALADALEQMGYEYKINEGDGAFYGPKIDFHLEDSIGRTWQCGTIQLDFQLPQRFEAEYIGEDGNRHRPIMLHRVVFGSIERFIGILIEHYAGKFPLWLAPVQIKLLPISDKFIMYAKDVMMQLKCLGFRCEIDVRDEKIGYKIRAAQLEKVPYMIIVGQKEEDNRTISVRDRERGDLGSVRIQEFMDLLYQEKEKSREADLCQHNRRGNQSGNTDLNGMCL